MSYRASKRGGLNPTFIRAWRQHRGLSLDRLVDRLDGVMPISKATLSRIETGKQPYTQDTLEALAWALNCEPADLIMRDPTSEAWSIWDDLKKMPPEQRKRAIKILRALADDEAA